MRVILHQTMTSASTTTVEEVRRLYVVHGAGLRQALARLAPELDADDLVQELFLIALSKVDELAHATSPHAWLYGVAVKLAFTRRRAARLRRFFRLSEAEHVSIVDSPARTVEQRDAQHRVSRALESLTSAKREVFVLFELQGLPGEDIASALQIPLKTVWSRLFNARKEVTASIERQLLAESRTSGLSRDEVEP
jgi:RNA polymerase sigma-70 factor, ECF subfamily